MNALSKTNTLRKSLLLYRFLRYRKGFGVHSPFAFSFITKVIDERCPYYCYDEIELVRKELQQAASFNRESADVKASAQMIDALELVLSHPNDKQQ